jgi:DNA-binding NtrC family response regulator
LPGLLVAQLGFTLAVSGRDAPGSDSCFANFEQAPHQRRIAPRTMSPVNGFVPKGTIVLIEDDRSIALTVTAVLERAGYEVTVVGDGASGLMSLSGSLPDAVCTDLGLPDTDGLTLIEQIRSRYAHLPVIVLTSNPEVDSVVEAMRRGAYDYLVKPVDATKLITTIGNACEKHAMTIRLAQLEREAGGHGYRGIIGESPAMKLLYRELDQVAATDITVLLHGESGTGKELVARAIHSYGSRRAQPFVAVNCAAIPESLHESELFGHEKGAFTGATARSAGRFEQAHGGTLFLDEVAELATGLQAKLLRVLQERRFYRVGGTSEIAVDVRVIAASHLDLGVAVRAGRFREDLFFRLAVFELSLPSLRHRSGDIELLAQSFVTRIGTEIGRQVAISPAALGVITSYEWPGNVRELHNALHRAIVACGERGVIDPVHLPARIVDASPVRLSQPALPPEPPSSTSLDDLERAAILAALQRTSGNLTQIARELGIGRTTLYRKLKRYGIST